MSVVMPFPKGQGQTGWDREEFMTILNLYGRMVAAGQWRDYAVRMDRDVAVFACFRRHAENPEIRIEKRPMLRHKQGMYALITEQGQVLKRGHELRPVLAPIERRLIKAVGD